MRLSDPTLALTPMSFGHEVRLQKQKLVQSFAKQFADCLQSDARIDVVMLALLCQGRAVPKHFLK